MKKAIVLLSGGIDSATALFWAKNNNIIPIGLSINFFNRSKEEIVLTRELAKKAQIKLIEVNLPFVKNLQDLVKDMDFIPINESLPPAYVPVKNIIFMGIAYYYAEIHQADSIILGLIVEDEGRFTDDSIDYFKRLEDLIKDGLPKGKWKGADIVFPFRKYKKTEILQLAIDLNVPLDLTWSCFGDNNGIPCGTCVSCIQRKEAFEQLGIEDPLLKKINKK